MKAADFDMEYRDLSDDKQDQRNVSDTRKPTMTLKNLNKLKKMRAANDLENAIRSDTLEIIYGTPAEGEGGGPPGGLM